MFTRSQSLLCCLAAIIVSLGGLNSSSPAESSSTSPYVPGEIARLIHKDTTIFAYTESASGLAKAVGTVLGKFEPQYAAVASFMSPEYLLGQLVITNNKIRGDHAVGIGLWGSIVVSESRYAVVFSVEGASPETVMARNKDTRLIFLEGSDWLAVTNADASWTPLDVSAPTPSIVQNLLPGQIACSFDQSALVQTVSRQYINKQIKEWAVKGGDDGQKWAEQTTIDLLESLFYGFERWDMGLDLGEENIDFQVQYLPTADSRYALKGTHDLVQIGNRLPGDLSEQFVSNTMFNAMILRVIKPFVVAQAGKDKELAGKFLDDLLALNAAQDGGNAFAMGLSEHGVDIAHVWKTKDVAATYALIDTYVKEVNEAKVGVNFERMPVLVGGDSSRAYRITFNKAEMHAANPGLAAISLGPEMLSSLENRGDKGLILRIISNKNWMAAVSGDPKLLGRMRRAIAQPPSMYNRNLEDISNRLQGDLAMAFSFDLRAFYLEAQEYLKAHPSSAIFNVLPASDFGLGQIDVKSGPPAVVDFSIDTNGDAVRMDFFFEIEKILSLHREITTELEMQKRAAEEAKAAQEKKAKEDGSPGKK